MAPLDIEALAKKHLIALEMWRLPVNPLAIAKQEGIELAPGQYGKKFDARIKFIRTAKTFILSYREACDGLTEGRVRFSVGHELGHYYLPHHREYLLRGLTHRSVTDFRSRDPREMEADEYSSALLMPSALFAGVLKTRNISICTLADLSSLAENTFQTSLTSTVRRYLGLDWEACSMVVTENGMVKWAKHSDSMRARGMGWIEYGTPVPNTTPTAKLWERLGKEATLERMEGGVDADIWFERPYRRRLWEEAMPLGYTGLVLTFLTAEEAD
jgi:IrrE N-terminal-like domain